ncbi:formate dehydrogenase accessory protein FdhE [Pasteurellaceae bacterium HPA106]|uniref:formate dehydrogenase accessory protein FdhE n=1 Tax=Spirabiliibacterium pneumoniae TaxID=221400 RepID=UPI001AAC5947|nr:formate dehydrogenase accessory protein FdhE [Spirabiliibacterium pneumoniae]MBE2895968.1 formate dehydrogenase accessory protein FdhE [Spirabiliibacterium pneumoniae]
MSTRILPESEIKQAAGEMYTPPLLFANPKNLYQRRAARLRQLSEKHPLQAYLRFCAAVADAQLAVLSEHSVPKDTRLAKLPTDDGLWQQKPLDAKRFQRDDVWLTLLSALLGKVKNDANDTILGTIEWLEKASNNELNTLADTLLAEGYLPQQSDKAFFLWAALSLYWVQLVQQLPRRKHSEIGEQRQTCPVCGSMPVASTIHIGESQGARYLHCGLCESEWHLVRALCSNCESGKSLHYWSIHGENAAVKAESCDECHSYLKVMYQDKDVDVEAIADDLASLFLDDEMEQKGYAKSTINPLLFPAE